MQEFLQQLIQAATPASTAPASVLSEVLALGFAAILGSVLAFVYTHTYTGKKDERLQITFTIILLCVGGALVWLLVADNLVRAFGLAGALSLIRYRTNVSDPKDTSMVFFSMLFGMACGVHQYTTAAVGVLMLSIILVIMKFVNTQVRKTMPYPASGNGNGSLSGTAEPEAGAEARVESAAPAAPRASADDED